MLRYLKSQPDTMIGYGECYDQLVDHISSSFPRAVGIAERFHGVAVACRDMAPRAHALYEAYRHLDADDINRHERPSVNEHLANIARTANGGNLPTISGGGEMHENHAIMLAGFRHCVADYFPSNDGEDGVRDFMLYLGGIGPVNLLLGSHMAGLVDHLLTYYPINKALHSFYGELGAGFAVLAGEGAATADLYVNGPGAHDARRRTDPRVHEEWADNGIGASAGSR
jgi:hypothetical protein